MLFQGDRRLRTCPVFPPASENGRQFRQAKIQNLSVISLRDKDVGRFDIPMNDARGVGRVQRIRNLHPKREHSLDV
jgi:hypothetical protein